MAPRAVLMKTCLKSFNTERPVNTVRSINTGRPFSTARSFNTIRPSYTAHPKSKIHYARPRTYFQNQAQSTVHRPFYKRTALTKRCFNQRFNIDRPFRSTVNTVRARGFNDVKPSACWVWRPRTDDPRKAKSQTKPSTKWKGQSQSDKSLEIKSNDYAFCVSSVKSSKPMTADSSSNASTSSVSTHASEANLESSEGTTIQEPIIVQELPSFSCTDKDVKTSRTPCNKNGYFNKKASHFRKNNSSASKSCFVCGSYLHLIKDCNYYETQYANDFDGMGYPQREPIWDNATRVAQLNQFVPQAVLLRSGKVSILAARPNQVTAGRPKPVSTGRPKPVSTDAPVSTGKQNRPPPVHAGRRNSSSVTSGWWQSTARPITHLPTPTSSYF
ncbi:hypothetical protein Tco_0190640 [Tanacetum coccineum]